MIVKMPSEEIYILETPLRAMPSVGWKWRYMYLIEFDVSTFKEKTKYSRKVSHTSVEHFNFLITINKITEKSRNANFGLILLPAEEYVEVCLKGLETNDWGNS